MILFFQAIFSTGYFSLESQGYFLIYKWGIQGPALGPGPGIKNPLNWENILKNILTH